MSAPEPQITQVSPRQIVGLEQAVTFGEDPLGAIIAALYEAIGQALPPDAPLGPCAILYRPTGERTARMLVGYSWSGPAPDGLIAAQTPGGPAVTARHVGPYEDLHATHMQIVRWASGRLTGVNWELYGDWSDDPAQRITDVYYALAE